MLINAYIQVIAFYITHSVYIVITKDLIDYNSFIDYKSIIDYINLISWEVAAKVMIGFITKKFTLVINNIKRIIVLGEDSEIWCFEIIIFMILLIILINMSY